jgi:hypothetical protein
MRPLIPAETATRDAFILNTFDGPHIAKTKLTRDYMERLHRASGMDQQS